MNAAALTVTLSDNSVAQLASDGACQFGIEEPTATLKVIASSGGLLVMHGQSKLVASERDLFFGIPEQTLPASELAGTWSVAEWIQPNIGVAGQVVASINEVTVDATGQITGVRNCLGLNPCTTESGPFAKFTANAGGGFDLVEGGATVGRMFLYKTLAGRKVSGAARQREQPVHRVAAGVAWRASGRGNGDELPAMLEFGGDSAVSALTEDQITVTAADTATRTITRIRTSRTVESTRRRSTSRATDCATAPRTAAPSTAPRSTARSTCNCRCRAWASR